MIDALSFFFMGVGLMGVLLFLATIVLAIAVRLLVLALVALGIYFAIAMLIDMATASTSTPIALEFLSEEDPGARQPSVMFHSTVSMWSVGALPMSVYCSRSYMYREVMVDG